MCSDVEYIFIYLIVLSKVVAADTPFGNGVGGRMAPAPHYIPIFGLSLIHQLQLFGSQQHPQSGIL
jgi:hypothetical protein